jgi:hypothetical protein
MKLKLYISPLISLMMNAATGYSQQVPSFFTHGIECRNVNNHIIEDYSGEGNPGLPVSERISLLYSKQTK